MADTILKAPTGSSNKLVLQSGAGNSALEVLDGGNITFGGTMTAGTLGNNVSVANCIIKKWHHLTFATRATGNAGAGTDQFTWTPNFVPIDPVNNSFWLTAIVPCSGSTNDFFGYGVRFAKSGGGNTDFHGKGVWACSVNATREATFQNYSFNIAAGVLSAGTYTLTHRCFAVNSQQHSINPSTTDGTRYSPTLTSEMMIREYKNP